MGEADKVNLSVSASGEAQVTAAGRDIHVHYGDASAVARRAISPGTADAECPYPGLASFDATQARWFFGRDAVTARATVLAAERLRDGGPMVVVGPSGAGKSSLLRAGLLTAIERGALPERGSANWPRLLLTPGARPLAELASQLAPVVNVPRLVIMIDQLEELFTLCPDESVRREFIDTCVALAADGALVVYGLRIDAYRHCAQYPALREALQDGQLLLGPMSLPELRQAIELPAREAGLELEPGLVDLMLSDLGVTEDGYEAGRLPLLGYALRATWQQRHGHILTVDGYRTTGGIRNAVATAAERAYASLPDGGREAAPGVFLRLVRLGDDTADTRRAMAVDDLAGDATAVIVVDAFTAARLLTRDEATVTITHESLLSAWPRLAEWIRTDRDELLRRQDVEEAAASWERAGHDPGLLLRGGRLEFAEQVKARLSPVATRLYAASARQRARGRRLRAGLAAVLALLTVAASTAAVVALNQAGKARSAASTARAEASTAQSELDQVIIRDLVSEAAQQHAQGNSALAAQLDLVAYRNWHGTDLATQDPSLYSGLVAGARQKLPLPPSNPSDLAVASAAFSADGHVLAVDTGNLGLNSHVQLWDVSTPRAPRLLSTVPVGNDAGGYLAISPDARVLAVGFRAIHLWDIANPRMPVPMPPIKAPCTVGTSDPSCIFEPFAGFTSADTLAVDWGVGTFLYHISESGAARPAGAPLALYGGPASAVAADPMAHLLVTGGSTSSGQEWLRVWDVSDPARPVLLPAPAVRGDFFNSGGVAIAGHRLAVFLDTQRGGVALWSVPGGKKIRGIPTVSKFVPLTTSLAVSQNGSTLSLVDENGGELRDWNLTGPGPPPEVGQPLTSPSATGFGSALAVSPDGTTVFTDGDYGTSIFLWNLNIAADVQAICAMKPELTRANWGQYVHGLPYSPPCGAGP